MKIVYRVIHLINNEEKYIDYDNFKEALNFMLFADGEKIIKITEEIIFTKNDIK